MMEKVKQIFRIWKTKRASLFENDPQQKRATGNVVHFFIGMLALTFIARGLAGITVPFVTVGHPERMELVQRISARGTIFAKESDWVTVPSGLMVKKVLCNVGQMVQKGDDLIEFDPNEIALVLELEQHKLEKLLNEQKTLALALPVDGSRVETAQVMLSRAEEDYVEQMKQGERAVANVQETYEETLAKENKARAESIALHNRAASLEDILGEASAKLDLLLKSQENAQVFLTSVEQTASSTMQIAQQQLDAAKQALQNALTDIQKAACQIALDSAQSSYDSQKAISEQTVLGAQQQYNEAAAKVNDALQSKNQIQSDYQSAKTEELSAANALEQAIASSRAARISFEDAQNNSQTSLKNASRSIEDAKRNLKESQNNLKQTQQQTNLLQKGHSIEASMLDFDVQKQKEQIALLSAVAQNGGIITSPFAGTIAELAVQSGEKASGGIARLTNHNGGNEIRFTLGENDCSDLEENAQLQIEAKQGIITVTLTALGPVDDVGNRIAYATLPDGDFGAGQTLNVTILKSSKIYDLCLPLEAVRSDGSGNYVLLLRSENTVLGMQNTLARMPIEVIEVDKQNAAVSGALTYDSIVVLSSQRPLSAGDKVRVKTP